MDPIRYSLGDVTLTRVPYADVLVDAGVVGLTTDQVEGIAWAEPTWAEHGQVRVAAAVWCLESHGRRMVVDPAQAADAILRTGADAITHQEAVATALAAAGHPRESIDTVIASHIDGIGMLAWLSEGGWTPFFSRAEILISEREHTAIVGPEPYRPEGADAYTDLVAHGVVTTVGEEHVVTPEVRLQWTGAHAPGHQIVHIASLGVEATMIGHLALSPLHLATDACTLHAEPTAAVAALRTIRDQGTLLVGPLWPTPGAGRWTRSGIRPEPPGDLTARVAR